LSTITFLRAGIRNRTHIRSCFHLHRRVRYSPVSQAHSAGNWHKQLQLDSGETLRCSALAVVAAKGPRWDRDMAGGAKGRTAGGRHPLLACLYRITERPRSCGVRLGREIPARMSIAAGGAPACVAVSVAIALSALGAKPINGAIPVTISEQTARLMSTALDVGGRGCRR